eukprot:scaffold62078_cov49-Prasinocladus_malaysianus.AAC.1
MLCGEAIEYSHVVAAAPTPEMYVAGKQACRKAVSLAEASPEELRSAGVEPVTYDRSKLQTGIVHIGLARGDSMPLEACHAVVLDRLLRANPEANYKWGYTAIGILPHTDNLRDLLKSQDYMYTVTAHSSKAMAPENVTADVRVIGSLKEIVLAFEEPGKVLDLLAAPTTRIFSMSVGEIGVQQDIPSHADMELVTLASDASAAPFHSIDADKEKYLGATGVGVLLAGLAARRACCSGGVTVLSSDPISENGEVLKSKVLERASAVDASLKDWIEFNCQFPNAHVDRMCNTPSKEQVSNICVCEQAIQYLAEKHSIADMWPVVCETFDEWIIEDKFVDGISGRPAWEEAGVKLVETLSPYTTAKKRLYAAAQMMCAFPGLLLGFQYTYESVQFAELLKFMKWMLENEIQKSLVNKPDIDQIDLQYYTDQAMDRLGNVLVSDPLQRITIDATTMISDQIVPAVVDGQNSEVVMKGCALLVAAWAHYVIRAVESRHKLQDDKARLIEAALGMQSGTKIENLLDIEVAFHELIFHQEWRANVSEAFDSITEIGLRETMSKLLDAAEN